MSDPVFWDKQEKYFKISPIDFSQHVISCWNCFHISRKSAIEQYNLLEFLLELDLSRHSCDPWRCISSCVANVGWYITGCLKLKQMFMPVFISAAFETANRACQRFIQPSSVPRIIYGIYLVSRPRYLNILLIFNAIQYVKMWGQRKIQLIILWFYLKYVLFSAIKVKKSLMYLIWYTGQKFCSKWNIALPTTVLEKKKKTTWYVLSKRNFLINANI